MKEEEGQLLFTCRDGAKLHNDNLRRQEDVYLLQSHGQVGLGQKRSTQYG